MLCEVSGSFARESIRELTRSRSARRTLPQALKSELQGEKSSEMSAIDLALLARSLCDLQDDERKRFRRTHAALHISAWGEAMRSASGLAATAPTSAQSYMRRQA